jgi:hypothetical protein
MEFTGYHGTNLDNRESILEEGLRPSIGYEEWLGDGAYLFIHGLSTTPCKQAEAWANAEAWDNNAKKHKYHEYCVIACGVAVEENEFLDLTTNEGVDILNYVMEKHVGKVREFTKTFNKRFDYIDGFLINFAREEKIVTPKVVKANVYIKFTSERKAVFNRRTQNATICAVYDPEENILSYRCVSTKKIKV